MTNTPDSYQTWQAGNLVNVTLTELGRQVQEVGVQITTVGSGMGHLCASIDRLAEVQTRASASTDRLIVKANWIAVIVAIAAIAQAVSAILALLR